MAAKKKHPVAKVYRRWGRKPAQKPHSTQKGRKGYDRRREQEATQEHVENS